MAATDDFVSEGMAIKELAHSYEVLGLEPGASLEEVRQAYLQQVQAWEPSSIRDNPALLEFVQAKNQEITAAYTRLVERLTPVDGDDAGDKSGDEIGDEAGESGLRDMESLGLAPTLEPVVKPAVDQLVTSVGQTEPTRLDLKDGAPDEALDEALAHAPALEGPPLSDSVRLTTPMPESSPPETMPPSEVLSSGVLSSGVPPTVVETPGSAPVAALAADPAASRYAGQGVGRQEPVHSSGGAVPTTMLEADVLDDGLEEEAGLGSESLLAGIFRLFRWDKPAGRAILMIPALWAVVLSAAMNRPTLPPGRPPLWLVLLIVVGSVAISAAGCVVNDWWDRDIDAQVERTRTRPLAQGLLPSWLGLALAGAALVIAALLAFKLPPLSFWLCVLALPVIILYPLAKRVFPVPQLVLAIAWGFAVLISWTAISGTLDERPMWILWGSTLLWTLGFDTIYAMADREDDRRLGINSSALFFRDQASSWVGLFFIGAALLLMWLGIAMPLPWIFWLTLALATLGWGLQHQRLQRLQRLQQSPLPRSAYTKMFNENVWIGLLLLLGMVLSTVVPR